MYTGYHVGETVCHGWVGAGASAVMSLDSYLRSTYLLILRLFYMLCIFLFFFGIDHSSMFQVSTCETRNARVEMPGSKKARKA
jgi:hypothetical protein